MEVNKICQFCGNRFVAKRLQQNAVPMTVLRSSTKRENEMKRFKRVIRILKYKLKVMILKKFKKRLLIYQRGYALLNISRTSIYRMLKDGRLSKLEGFKAIRIRKVD
jgi:hypothetical protein